PSRPEARPSPSPRAASTRARPHERGLLSWCFSLEQPLRVALHGLAQQRIGRAAEALDHPAPEVFRALVLVLVGDLGPLRRVLALAVARPLAVAVVLVVLLIAGHLQQALRFLLVARAAIAVAFFQRLLRVVHR